MTTDSSTPVKVEGLSDVVVTSISAGGYHNCALITSGAIKCWGGNKDRQLGDGTTDNHYIPIDVIGLSSGAVALTTSKLNTCAIVQLGGLECWGDFLLGGAVNGGGDIPTKVIGLAGSVVDVSAGYQDTCVLISNGGAQCWGFNDDGQLGDGTTQGSNHPVTVLGLHGTWKAITVGSIHTCSLATNGAAMCWGNNDWGQLGDGTNSRRHIPVAVVGL
jgi:alpha-tubulin suppressor-like RCC1 family protein